MTAMHARYIDADGITRFGNPVALSLGALAHAWGADIITATLAASQVAAEIDRIGYDAQALADALRERLAA